MKNTNHQAGGKSSRPAQPRQALNTTGAQLRKVAPQPHTNGTAPSAPLTRDASDGRKRFEAMEGLSDCQDEAYALFWLMTDALSADATGGTPAGAIRAGIQTLYWHLTDAMGSHLRAVNGEPARMETPFNLEDIQNANAALLWLLEEQLMSLSKQGMVPDALANGFVRLSGFVTSALQQNIEALRAEKRAAESASKGGAR